MRLLSLTFPITCFCQSEATASRLVPAAAVKAKLLETAFAFDREVVPVGTIAQGTVIRVRNCSNWQRTGAILNGTSPRFAKPRLNSAL